MVTVRLPEPATQVELNVDNLGVNLDGAQVLAHQYIYDVGGDNWDRVRGVGGAIAVDTELAPAILAADNMANPTVPQVLSNLMLFDGATWDRAPGDAATGLVVNSELPAAAALADAMANPTTPLVGACLMGFNGATWERIFLTGGAISVQTQHASGLLTDAHANPNGIFADSFMMGYNGATWDRLVSSIAQGLEVDVTRVQGNVAVTNAGLTELAAAINASRMDVNIAASIALDVSAATVTVDSELPAAAALSDAFANPTAPAVGAFDMVFDGTVWQRARGIEEPNNLAGRAIGQQAVGKSEGKVTYRVTFADLAGVAGVALQIIGSATTIVRVTRIQFSKPSTAQAPLIFTKNSAAATGGTSTTPAIIPLDSADVAATAVIRLYTVAPTPGASVGNIYDADHGTSDVLYETFGDEQNTQSVVLRGVAEAATIVLQADATINGYIEFTEE